MQDRIPPEVRARAAAAAARDVLAEADDLPLCIAPAEILTYHVAALRTALRSLLDTVEPEDTLTSADAECGARKPGWENGPAIGANRIPCVRAAGHNGPHRDGLGQCWTGANR